MLSWLKVKFLVVDDEDVVFLETGNDITFGEALCIVAALDCVQCRYVKGEEGCLPVRCRLRVIMLSFCSGRG